MAMIHKHRYNKGSLCRQEWANRSALDSWICGRRGSEVTALAVAYVYRSSGSQRPPAPAAHRPLCCDVSGSSHVTTWWTMKRFEHNLNENMNDWFRNGGQDAVGVLMPCGLRGSGEMQAFGICLLKCTRQITPPVLLWCRSITQSWTQDALAACGWWNRKLRVTAARLTIRVATLKWCSSLIHGSTRNACSLSGNAQWDEVSLSRTAVADHLIIRITATALPRH